MKNRFCHLALGLLAAIPAAAQADIYTFDANISNFDSGNVFTHNFSLGDVQEILSVSIDLTHTRAADIDFTLKAPGGFQTFVLSTDNGGTSDLGGTYTFVNVAGPNGGNGFWTNVGSTVTITPGIYDAESWITPSTGWAAGTWTLTLDDDTSGETGSVGTVMVEYVSAVPEPGSIMLLFGTCGLAAANFRRRKR